MASNFVIFEDQENFKDNQQSTLVDQHKRDKMPLQMLKNATTNENLGENQVRKSL